MAHLAVLHLQESFLGPHQSPLLLLEVSLQVSFLIAFKNSLLLIMVCDISQRRPILRDILCIGCDHLILTGLVLVLKRKSFKENFVEKVDFVKGRALFPSSI